MAPVPPGVRAFRGYRREWLVKDLVAGVVLTTLLVPQGMAYAELAGPAADHRPVHVASLACSATRCSARRGSSCSGPTPRSGR